MPRPRLGSIDVAVPLAATLRGGVLDELGWPALDEAVEELGAGGQRHWSASWPVLVVWNSSRVIAVGPGGRVAEHDLRLTYPHGGIPRVLYADGQFLVVPPNPDGPAYWSGAPTETFTIEHARPWGWFSHTASGFARCCRRTATPAGQSNGRRAFHMPCASWIPAPASLAASPCRRFSRTAPHRVRRSCSCAARSHRCPMALPARRLAAMAASSGSGWPRLAQGGRRGSRASTDAVSRFPFTSATRSGWSPGQGHRSRACSPADPGARWRCGIRA